MKTLASPLGDSIAVVEVSSVTLGFRALDLITQNEKLEVHEASSHGSKSFTILARGKKSQLETAVKAVSSSLLSTGDSKLRDSIVIETIAPEIVETYFSLHTTQLADSLLVVETETLSGLFEAAHRAIKDHKLKSIELRNLRGDSPTAIGFFTGNYAECVSASENIRLSLSNHARTGTAEVIKTPNENFRQFFNLSNV